MRSRTALAVTIGLVSTLLLSPASTAHADCAADPDALTLRQIIRQGRTGVDRYPVMFLGKVVTTRDVRGGPGGAAIARTAVAAHPVGFAPLVSRIRFWRPPPGVGVSVNLEFKAGERYAVIASRTRDGSFRSDGACGQTTRLSRTRFQRLVQLTRSV